MNSVVSTQPPYKWEFVSINRGWDCLEYWIAQCSVTDCHGHAEADWKIDPRRLPTLRPLCPDHQKDKP